MSHLTSLDGAALGSEGNVIDHHAANVTDAVPAARRPKSTMIEMQPLPMKRSEMQPSYAQDLGVTHGIWGQPFHRVQQGSVGLISRFDEFYKSVDPGLVQVNVCTESIEVVNVRIQIMPIGRQTVITRDNVKVEIESDIYFQICNPYRATFDISNMRGVLLERAQLTLRHVVGARGVRSVLTEREDIASEITDIVNDIANKWGVAIESILIKDISTEISADASVGESEVIAIKSQTVKPPKALPKTLQKVRPNS